MGSATVHSYRKLVTLTPGNRGCGRNVRATAGGRRSEGRWIRPAGYQPETPAPEMAQRHGKRINLPATPCFTGGAASATVHARPSAAGLNPPVTGRLSNKQE